MKLFLASAITLEGSHIALVVKHRLRLSTRLFHQGDLALCFWRSAHCWLLRELVSLLCSFFRKAALFALEQGHDCFTQVRQEMPAIGYLLGVRSALLHGLCVRAGSISTHEVDIWMRFEPSHDGCGFAIRQQL